jgi:hypothetical protein
MIKPVVISGLPFNMKEEPIQTIKPIETANRISTVGKNNEQRRPI